MKEITYVGSLETPKKSQINNLLNGVEVDGKRSSFDKLISINKKSNAQNTWYRATLHSGRNREVRKLWESQSLQVSRLIRIGFGPIKLPENLKKGQYKTLDEKRDKKSDETSWSRRLNL